MFPGTLELDLRNLVSPAKTPEKCSLSMMDDMEMGGPDKTEQAKSLFAQQSVRGWWPCSIEEDGKKVLGVSMKRYFGVVFSFILGNGLFWTVLSSKGMKKTIQWGKWS